MPNPSDMTPSDFVAEFTTFEAHMGAQKLFTGLKEVSLTIVYGDPAGNCQFWKHPPDPSPCPTHDTPSKRHNSTIVDSG